MQDSLSNLVDNLSGINNKVSQNKFIDNMRSMVFSLTQSINKILEIDKKISQIDKKEADNIFTDNMRSMISPLLQFIDRVSEINKDLNKFALLFKKRCLSL